MIERLLAGLLAAAFSAGVLAEDPWSVASAMDGDRPLIARYRTAVPDAIVTSDYPDLVILSWKYDSKSGMPSPLESERMTDMEERVRAAVETAGQAYLTVVVTGNGVCEWQFYSKESRMFIQMLNEALSGRPVYPIQISDQEDPEWSAYKRFSEAE